MPILLQISWIFQNTPNILNFDNTERELWQFEQKFAFLFLNVYPEKRMLSLTQIFSAILKSIFDCNTIFASIFIHEKSILNLMIKLAWEAQFTNEEEV